MKNGLVYLLYESRVQACRNWSSILDTQYPLCAAIIDNASTDGAASLFQSRGFPVHINEKNMGFTYGVNQGLKMLLEQDMDWIVILNPDVNCPPKWDAALLDPLTEEPTCGIVGARLVNPNGTLLHAGGIIAKPQLMFWSTCHDLGNGKAVVQNDAVCMTRFQHNLNDCKEPRKAPWVTFAAVALRAEMLRQVGLLDETYFLYCSDSQLCMRAWKSGWSVWYNPVTFVHEGSASMSAAGDDIQQMAQNDVRRFALMEEESWVHSVVDGLPKQM
jgi:hypothetical protein